MQHQKLIFGTNKLNEQQPRTELLGTLKETAPTGTIF